MNFKFYCTLIFVFIFYSCNIDNILNPKLPTWSIDLDVPLIEKTILLRDNILDIDSSITIYPDINTDNEFDSVFVYKLTEQIDSTFIDDKLNIQDVIDTTITQSVDDISIENILLTEIINFSDVGIEPVSSALSTEIGLIVLDDRTIREVLSPMPESAKLTLMATNIKQTFKTQGPEAGCRIAPPNVNSFWMIRVG